MSDYCKCCASNVEHIRQHYDPDGLTKPDEDAAEVLRIFRDCFHEECTLSLRDVEEYIEALKD